MKRILLVLLSLLLVVPYASFAENPISVYLDGQKQNYNQAPTIQNGSTLVPLRGIFESLGAKVGWDGATRTVTASKGDININLQIGSKSPIINGVTKSISVPAQIINGSTFVPFRFVSEAFGANVKWDGAARFIAITTYDVVLNFPSDKYPETAAHIKNAISKGKSSICTVDRVGAEDNRDKSLAEIPTKEGFDRDEWPMAMCGEGGAGADIAYVTPTDNRGAGSWVSNQLEQYPDGTRVLFVIDGNVNVNPQPVTPVSKPVPPVPAVKDLPKSDYNCSDFKTQAEAQAVFEAAGGLKGLDLYRLDSDGDKIVCESLK